MRYLTYAEYKEIGGTLEETAFNRHIDRACGVIKNYTSGRLDSMKKFPDEAKALCRDVVEHFASGIGSSERVSSHSQSAGGVSESESFVIRSTEERAGELEDMIKDYLIELTDDRGVPLLYRGCWR